MRWCRRRAIFLRSQILFTPDEVGDRELGATAGQIHRPFFFHRAAVFIVCTSRRDRDRGRAVATYLTALRCVPPPSPPAACHTGRDTGSMCDKRMIGGGWAQQLGGHARPRHSTHLCRHFPRHWRRLGASSTRSRWKAALVDRWCWCSRASALFGERRSRECGPGPEEAADVHDLSAACSRPEP